MSFRHAAAAAGVTVLLSALAGSAAAQTENRERFVPPVAGQWEPLRSLGQPARWKPYVGAGLGLDAPARPGGLGVAGTAGVYRDLVNPVLAMLGVAGEVYVGQRGTRLDTGARLQLVSPALHVRAGVDWNARLERLDLAAALTLPPTRGGWFGQGGQLRFDYVPARDHSLIAGFELPVGRRAAVRTRPRRIVADLPVVAAARARPVRAAAESELVSAMRWIAQTQTVAWRMGDGPLQHEAAASHARRALQDVAAEHALQAPPEPGRSLYTGTVEQYHAALTSAFARGIAAHPGAAITADELASEARRVVREEVVLPYNRLIGQPRHPDQLQGLAARARARFLARLLLRGLPPGATAATLGIFDGWLQDFENVRAHLARATRDSRRHWLPLALVLRPEEHATQAQLDALVETALGRPFTGGNETRYIDALHFPSELLRTIHATEAYHVLWVHDYRGFDERGEPDRIGYVQTTSGYLRALLERVRAYDETGRLPVYMMIIDQHSYEEHDARLWLDLLERPLTHRVRLPERHTEMRATIAALQDSLRAAIAASHRLTAHAQAFGSDWVEQVVRVYVNITFPSDPSYRAPTALRLPWAGDNLMRDHRKIVIRDITDADPALGEVILTGVGVGDRYATPDWDDRALVLSGPAALEAKHAARVVLETHGLTGASLPPPLRPVPAGGDAAPADTGAGARVLQVHNRTGFGDKDATFVQLLLYDLAPAGTVIYVPDSLWLSFDRLGQLLQAALRGCHVIIVAPSLANAPNTGFPQLSRMQELVTRAAVIEEQLGAAIRAGGGDFRVGLYTREAPLDDVAGMLAEFERTYATTPFLRALFPLNDDVLATLRGVRLAFAADGTAGTAAPPQQRDAGTPPPVHGAATPREHGAATRPPMLHRKTQLLAGREALRALAGARGLADAFSIELHELRHGFAPDAPLPHSGAMMLPGLFRDARPPHAQDPPFYLLAGTMNMDPRSAMLDGEATAVVAGEWAAEAFIDFVLLSAGVTWLESVEQAAALLPPLPRLQRWLGRLLHPVL